MRKRVSAVALLVMMIALAAPGLAAAQPNGLPPLLQTTFFQDFETDTAGWFDTETGHHNGIDEWFGSVERVASGTGGVTAASGDFFAQFQGHPTDETPDGGHTGPYTHFGGYSDVWLGAWVAEVAVYINPADYEIGEGFDYAVAVNGTDGANEQDFTFNTGKQENGEYLVGFSNGTNFEVMLNLASDNHALINSAGWYILQHVFKDDEGVLEVSMNVLNADRLTLASETHRYEENTIPDVIGGNRYGWFTFISLGITLPVDHTLRQVQDSSGFQVDFGALSARGTEGASDPGTLTIQLRGAIVTELTGRARFEATLVIDTETVIFNCAALTTADFTIFFADGTSMTAAIDHSKWTNFGIICDFGARFTFTIVASLISNTSGYEVLEQTIGFLMETFETGPGLAAPFKGYFLNGPVPPGLGIDICCIP